MLVRSTNPAEDKMWGQLEAHDERGCIMVLLPGTYGQRLYQKGQRAAFEREFVVIDQPELEGVEPKTESQLRDENARLRAENRRLKILLDGVKEIACNA